MNKGDIKNKTKDGGTEKLINLSPIKTIYLVKYNEIHHRPDSGRVKNSTYNLFTFEDLDAAKDYMDSSYETIVTPQIQSGKFRIYIDSIMHKSQMDSNNNIILYKRVTKIIGNKEVNCSQTKLYTFTVEEINFKPSK